MHAYDIVLFLYLLAVFATIGLGTLLIGTEKTAAKATQVAELRAFGRLVKLGFLFPIFSILLLGFGIGLVFMSPAEDKFHFSDPFVWCGLTTIGLLSLTGTIMKPWSDRAASAIASAPEGEVTDGLRASVFATLPMTISHGNMVLVVGTAFDMVASRTP